MNVFDLIKVQIKAGKYDLNNLLWLIEEESLHLAMQEAKGVKTHAAKLLGIKRTTLVQKLKARGLFERAVVNQRARSKEAHRTVKSNGRPIVQEGADE